jgi:nucleoside-diphosphate-sugar epimerase
MRIFVTGATGFIGAHFIERALAAGHEVLGLYRSDNGARKQALIEQLRAQGAKFHRGDILDQASMEGAMRGAECVCHFAAAFKESHVDDDYFQRINVEGTANVVKAAAKQGIRRFIHCSTAGIYGQKVAGLIDETAPVQPWNIYERTKLAAERQVREGTRAAGMEYVILRPTAVYGPRDERLLKLFRSAAKGRFPLFGRGEGRRHMIYVTDLADAFLCAATEPEAANQELIIAGPQAVPLRDLLQTLALAANRRSFGPRLPLGPMMSLAAVVEDVCKWLSVKPPIYRRRMDFYLNDAAFDSRRAQRILQWRPQVDLSEGLARTLRTLSTEGQQFSVNSLAMVEGVIAVEVLTDMSSLWTRMAI